MGSLSEEMADDTARSVAFEGEALATAEGIAAEYDVEELRAHRNAVLAEMGATPANGFELDEEKVDRLKVEKAVILTNALKRAIERRDALLP